MSACITKRSHTTMMTGMPRTSHLALPSSSVKRRYADETSAIAVSRLRALSAWSNLALAVQAREVSLQRELAAVGVLEPGAALPELREQLEDERAGEPHGVERIDPAHLHRLLLQRLDEHARDPSVAFLVRRANAGLDVDSPAILQDRGDVQGGDEPLHHGIGDPSCERN